MADAAYKGCKVFSNIIMWLRLSTLISMVYLCQGSLDIYYMDEHCGSTLDLTDIQSVSVETSKALTYPNNLDCRVSFRAPPGKRFFLLVTRFMTEFSTGRCYDYLSLFDGASVSSPAIASKLCGELEGEPEFNTTGELITFEFVSDDSAKDRGFAVLLLAFKLGPSCSSDEFLCINRDICIDEETTVCDDFDHCGDRTDEASCTNVGDSASTLATSIGLIIGVSVAGVAILIVVLLLARVCYKKYKWNQYLKQLYQSKTLVKAKVAASYPLTHHYQNEEFINITRAEREAAMVRLEDTQPQDVPFGSSASLASSKITVRENHKMANPDTERENRPSSGENQESHALDSSERKPGASDDSHGIQGENREHAEPTTGTGEQPPNYTASVVKDPNHIASVSEDAFDDPVATNSNPDKVTEL